MDDRSSTLRRGGWLREGASHSSQFGAYRAPRSFDPAGAFAGNNPLAAWSNHVNEYLFTHAVG